jgi:hypothetical protein
MTAELLTHKKLTVRERKGIIQFTDIYDIYAEDGSVIGAIKQKTNFLSRILHVVISYTWLPFSYLLLDKDGEVIARFSKNWEPWSAFMSIKDKKHKIIGYIGTEFSLFNSVFCVSDINQRRLAKITGNWRAHKFETLYEKNQKNLVHVEIKPQNIFMRLLMPRDTFTFELKDSQIGSIEKNLLTIASLLVPIIFKEISS